MKKIYIYSFFKISYLHKLHFLSKKSSFTIVMLSLGNVPKNWDLHMSSAMIDGGHISRTSERGEDKSNWFMAAEDI